MQGSEELLAPLRQCGPSRGQLCWGIFHPASDSQAHAKTCDCLHSKLRLCENPSLLNLMWSASRHVRTLRISSNHALLPLPSLLQRCEASLFFCGPDLVKFC